MKYYFIIIIFIFFVNCSFNKSELGVTSKNLSQHEIDFSKKYSFEQYVIKLLNINKSKKYPKINNFPD